MYLLLQSSLPSVLYCGICETSIPQSSFPLTLSDMRNDVLTVVANQCELVEEQQWRNAKL